MIRKKHPYRDPLHAETRLLEFWRRRLRKIKPDALSDFEAVFQRAKDKEHRSFVLSATGQTDLAWRITKGGPLTFVEYHAALASGMLLGEVPYVEFFKHHWHETPYCRGYATVKTCPECQRRNT